MIGAGQSAATLGWEGRLPSSSRYFFAAGDSRYFKFFASALALSAHQHGNPLHLHVINPSEDNLRVAAAINTNLDGVTVSWVADEAESRYEAEDRLAYYACIRIHVLPRLLARPGAIRVYAMDFDSLFNRPCVMGGPKQSLGLFFRDTPSFAKVPGIEKPGMKVLASLWWVDSVRLDYAQAVADYVAARPVRWMVDQEALYALVQEMGLRSIAGDLADYRNDMLDWTFSPRGVLWTGKGLRKFRPVFIERVRDLNQQFKALL